MAGAGFYGGHEDDQALAVVDHGLEGWPGGWCGALGGRLVGVVGDVGCCEFGVEIGGGSIVGVD